MTSPQNPSLGGPFPAQQQWDQQHLFPLSLRACSMSRRRSWRVPVTSHSVTPPQSENSHELVAAAIPREGPWAQPHEGHSHCLPSAANAGEPSPNPWDHSNGRRWLRHSHHPKADPPQHAEPPACHTLCKPRCEETPSCPPQQHRAGTTHISHARLGGASQTPALKRWPWHA